MSATKITLESFIKLAPVGREPLNYQELLRIFLSGEHEEIAIVNSQNFPVGTIRFRNLIPYLLKQAANQREQEDKIWSEAIEPLAIFPAKTSVTKFYQTNYQSDRSAAVVKDSGELLGLLDTRSIIKYLLREDLPRLEGAASARKDSFSILEKLPVPLRIETKGGTVIYQNSSWREKIARNSEQTTLAATDDRLLNRKQQQKEIASQEVAVNIALERNAEQPPQNERGWEFVKLPLELSATDWQTEAIAKEIFAIAEGKHDREDRQIIADSVTALTAEKKFIWLILANESREIAAEVEQELATKKTDPNRANLLKNELLASIAHELKSPLTAIVGLSNLLQEKKLGQLNQRQNRYAEQIYQSAQQLMRLLNQFLDLTALETRQLKLSFNKIKIKPVCDRAIETIAQQYRDKIGSQAIQLTLDLEENLHEVIADELRLQQILIYLLENALISLDTRGKISLSVTHFYRDWIAFSVKDTAQLAIAEEFQYLATFQMLKSPNSATIAAKNSGLGLVMADRLAKAQQGDLTFICTQNKGNEFKILLRAAGNIRKNYYITDDRVILVVESIAKEIENLTAKLQNFGYKFIIARSGNEALFKAQKFRPDAIFLNPYLPLLNGWETLQLLKSDPQTKDIPTYITSSFLEDKQLSLTRGADGFLTLPVNKQALQKILVARERETPVRDKNLTILCLQVIPEKSGCLSAMVDRQLHGLNYRILEADSLEQAEILARIWQIDAIVLEGNFLDKPRDFFGALCHCDSLVSLPLVTMDARTTEAANQYKKLSVFPCLVPLQEKGYSNLLEVIQIATKIDR